MAKQHNELSQATNVEDIPIIGSPHESLIHSQISDLVCHGK